MLCYNPFWIKVILWSISFMATSHGMFFRLKHRLSPVWMVCLKIPGIDKWYSISYLYHTKLSLCHVVDCNTIPYHTNAEAIRHVADEYHVQYFIFWKKCLVTLWHLEKKTSKAICFIASSISLPSFNAEEVPAESIIPDLDWVEVLIVSWDLSRNLLGSRYLICAGARELLNITWYVQKLLFTLIEDQVMFVPLSKKVLKYV